MNPKKRSLTSSTVGFEPTHIGEEKRRVPTDDASRETRRCFLRVQPGKGLGFVLSANSDYDHTITSVEKGSIADAAGLQVNDALLEVNGTEVRQIKYEEVVDMLISAMKNENMIEMRVIDSRYRDQYSSAMDHEQSYPLGENKNNNNNRFSPSNERNSRGASINDDDHFSDMHGSLSTIHHIKFKPVTTSDPNLNDRKNSLQSVSKGSLSGSLPGLTTGITATPREMRETNNSLNLTDNDSIGRFSDGNKGEAPVARLCRIRKLPHSPFYGFYLCGDPRKPGRVFISDVTKNSPAAVCGLRDGDRIVEINGVPVQSETYETILNKIRQHMDQDDLELLVMDKKSLRWYQERNFPITSRTLPTLVHIEPIINNISNLNQGSVQSLKTDAVSDRRVSTTSL